MWFSALLKKRLRAAPRRGSDVSRRKRSTCRPRLEALEDRTVPSGGYRFSTIDDPSGSQGNFAFGINSSGAIVGRYTDANSVTHGFLLKGGQYTTLDDPYAVGGGTIATGINAQGHP